VFVNRTFYSLRQQGAFYFNCVSFFALRAKKETQLGLTQLRHAASQRHVFACGSKVLTAHT
jgi:hypothetical protein